MDSVEQVERKRSRLHIVVILLTCIIYTCDDTELHLGIHFLF